MFFSTLLAAAAAFELAHGLSSSLKQITGFTSTPTKATMYAYIRAGTALSAQLRLNRLLAPKRTNPGLRVVEGGWSKDNRKDPKGSGWVH